MHHPLRALMKNMLHLVTCHAVNSWSNSSCETRCQVFRHLIKPPGSCQMFISCHIQRFHQDVTLLSGKGAVKSLISDEETNCNHGILLQINHSFRCFQSWLWKLCQQRHGWSNRRAHNWWGSIDLYRGQIQTRPHRSDASTSSDCPQANVNENDWLTPLFELRKEATNVIFPSPPIGVLFKNALWHLSAAYDAIIFILEV